jgi:hypothetical protein
MVESTPTPLSVVCVSSSVAGIVARFICHPIDTIKARLQVKDSQALLRNLSIRSLYSGFPAVAIGGTPATCLYLTSYEVSKNSLSNRQLPNWLVHFCAGMIAETISCTVFVPVDVVKERMQVQNSANGGPIRYLTSWHCFKTILAEEKLRGIYKGYGATLVSFGPFSAIYFTVYENSKSIMTKGGNDSLSALQTLACASSAGALSAWVTSPLDMAKLRLQVIASELLLYLFLSFSNRSIFCFVFIVVAMFN